MILSEYKSDSCNDSRLKKSNSSVSAIWVGRMIVHVFNLSFRTQCLCIRLDVNLPEKLRDTSMVVNIAPYTWERDRNVNRASSNGFQTYTDEMLPANDFLKRHQQTLSFLLALNFFRHSTVSCLCIMDATVERCCGKQSNWIIDSNYKYCFASSFES